MAYKATQDVVRRVMPLLALFSSRTVDRARLLQYLSARSGIDWGVLELADERWEEPSAGGSDRVLVVRDRATGNVHRVRYPSCLPEAIEPLVREEYKRLASGNDLTLISEELFQHFYGRSHCASCAWQGERYRQFHIECRYAGRPVNYQALEDDIPF
jgi:hypothetical protein